MVNGPLNLFKSANFDIIFDKLLIVGDNFSFSGPVLDDYSDGSWTATFTLAAGTSRLTALATTSAGRFVWDIPGTNTGNLIAGPYLFVITVSNGTDRFTLQRGSVTVLQ